MKKVLLLLSLTVSTLFFVSCSKEDENTQQEKAIIGKWYLHSRKYLGRVDIEEYSSICGKSYIQFKEGNKYQRVYIDKKDCYEKLFYGTYSVNDNMLVIKEEYRSEERYTLELSEDKLIMKKPEIPPHNYKSSLIYRRL